MYDRSCPGSYPRHWERTTSGGPIVAMTGGIVVIGLRELLDELPGARVLAVGWPPGYRRTRRRSPCTGAPIAS